MRYEFLIKTITPLHIGNGERWFPFEYWVEDGKIMIGDFNKFIDTYENYISGTTWKTKLKKVLDIFRNPKNYRNRRFELSFLDILKQLNISDKRSEFLLLEIPFSKVLSDKEGNVKKEIYQFIRHSDGRIYIPGSSIKGAINTAFIFEKASIGKIKGLYVEKNKHVDPLLGYRKPFNDPSNMHVPDIELDNQTTFIDCINRLGFSGGKLSGVEVIHIKDSDSAFACVSVKTDISSNQLIEVVNRFSLKSIEYSLEISAVKLNKQVKSALEDLRERVQEYLKNKEGMLLQLGGGGCYFNKSIGAKLIEIATPQGLDDRYLFRLRQKFQFGRNPRTKRYAKKFPRTFAVNSEYKPFGWVALELKK